jgi:hypothetical protein
MLRESILAFFIVKHITMPTIQFVPACAGRRVAANK